MQTIFEITAIVDAETAGEFDRAIRDLAEDFGLLLGPSPEEPCLAMFRAEECEDTEDMTDELADSEPEKTRALSF